MPAGPICIRASNLRNRLQIREFWSQSLEHFAQQTRPPIYTGWQAKSRSHTKPLEWAEKETSACCSTMLSHPCLSFLLFVLAATFTPTATAP